MPCDDCRFAEGVPNYVPYGSTTVLEATYLNCLKGHDPDDCPEDEYQQIDPFELMPGYQRARDAGVD
jgi:hypothetical protein